MDVQLPFLLRLGCHSKQARDERNLACDVPFVSPLHLPFPHEVHHLIALKRPPRRLQGKEAHARFDEPFDEAVILLYDGVEVLHSPQFTVLREIALCFQLLEGFWIGCVFVHRDHPRRHSMRCGKHFAEKVFGCLGIACRTQEEVQRIACRVHRSIQIRPRAFNLDVGFVDAQGIRGRFEMGPPAHLQFRCIALHSAIDRGVVHM